MTMPATSQPEHAYDKAKDNKKPLIEPLQVQNPVTNLPPGLPNIELPPHGAIDVIATSNSLVVVQSPEPFEIMTGFETQNNYVVKDMFMRPILNAFERSNVMRRMFAGKRRDFTMEFSDIYGGIIMKGIRSLLCCSDEFRFEYPIGQRLGTVTMDGCDKSFYVQPCQGPRLMVQTPCCSLGSTHFPVVLAGGFRIGEIVRLYPGYFARQISDADTFMVHFNPGLPVYLKLLMMGTVFLMDFVYFEDNERKTHRRR